MATKLSFDAANIYAHGLAGRIEMKGLKNKKRTKPNEDDHWIAAMQHSIILE